MTSPPELVLFGGDWPTYEEEVYQAFLQSFVRPSISFRGARVTAPYRPPFRDKHFSFWHVISEAPHPGNRDEADRVPDLRRCERIRWIAWAVERASAGASGFTCWETTRRGDRRVVIWVEDHDYVVVLAKRRGYCMLKTAYYGITPHQRRALKRERDARIGQKD